MLNPDYYPARLEALYDAYLTTVEGLERNRKFGEGMFGFRGGPADNPCHDRFAEDLRALLGDFAAAEPDSADIRTMLAWVYEAPKRGAVPKSAYWMLIAVQALTKELIGGLSAEDARSLAARFEELYPRHERLPVQIELIRLLRGPEAEAPRGLSRFWKR